MDKLEGMLFFITNVMRLDSPITIIADINLRVADSRQYYYYWRERNLESDSLYGLLYPAIKDCATKRNGYNSINRDDYIKACAYVGRNPVAGEVNNTEIYALMDDAVKVFSR